MFEHIVQSVSAEKFSRFELNLSDWVAHNRFDLCLDAILGSVVLFGMLIPGAYNLFTFSLGGQ